METNKERKSFSELLQASFKSNDTEEWLDVHFTRPIGLVFALLWNSMNIHPNVITILSICTFLFVLFIIIKRDEGTYKILWLLVLLTLPVLGAVLYLELGNKRTGRPILRRLQRVKQDRKIDCRQIVEDIKQDDIRLAQTIQILCNRTNLPVVPNEQVTYYPLGDNMYPDMIADLRSATEYIYRCPCVV